MLRISSTGTYRALLWVFITYATAITLGYTYQLTTISQLQLDNAYQKFISRAILIEYYRKEQYCPRTYTYNPHTPDFYSPEEG